MSLDHCERQTNPFVELRRISHLFLVAALIALLAPQLAVAGPIDPMDIDPPEGNLDITIQKDIRISGLDWMPADDMASAPVTLFPSDAEYRITVTNTGSDALLNVTVDDPAPLVLLNVNLGALAAGESVVLAPPEYPELAVADVCTGPGTFTNTASVTAESKAAGGGNVEDSNSAVLVCIAQPVPAIQIKKQIKVGGLPWQDADDAATAPEAIFPSGANYRIRLENTGEALLIGVTVTDPILGLVGLDAVEIDFMDSGDVIYLLPPSEPPPPDGTLDPIVVEDLEVETVCDAPGTFTNTAFVEAEDKATQEIVMDDDPANLVCVDPPVPDIEIVKQIRLPGLDWVDADDVATAPEAQFPSGADYRIRLENTGETLLINITVTDPILGLVGLDAVEIDFMEPDDVIYLLPPGEPPPPDGTLDPIEVEDLEVETVCDAPGTFTNTAFVEAEDKATNEVVTDDDPANLVCVGLDVCLVVIDEEGLDNDFRSIEDAAAIISNAGFNVEPDELINDDRPTETGNPPLLWNQLVAAGLVPDPDGRLVLLPTGEVDDEGWFALPPGPDIRYKQNSRPPNCGLAGGYDEWIDRFVAGTLSQHCLDEVLDVMPLRNQDLATLIGRTCMAIVYDSDININYHPLFGNLQGARYGQFSFTVMAAELPGSLPESGSSTSLYDLWLYVESPLDGGEPLQVPLRDHEPDAVETVTASWSFGVLTVVGASDFAPGAQMTVSVDGADAGGDPLIDPYLFEEPMIYIGSGRYRLVLDPSIDVRGRRVSIQTDEGGAYNDYIGGGAKSSR